MAMTGPRTLTIAFDGLDQSDAPTGGSLPLQHVQTGFIDTSGLMVEELTLATIGVQIQRPGLMVEAKTLINPAAASQWLPLTAPVNTIIDPRQTVLHFPTISYVRERLILSREPIPAALLERPGTYLPQPSFNDEDQEWADVIYVRDSVGQTLSLSEMTFLQWLQETGVAEWGSMAPVVGDQLHYGFWTEIAPAHDPLSAIPGHFDLSTFQWRYNAPRVVLATEVVKEQENVRIFRMAEQLG